MLFENELIHQNEASHTIDWKIRSPHLLELVIRHRDSQIHGEVSIVLQIEMFRSIY